MGIDNTYANENWIQIFPNPVHDELTVEANLSSFQIEIFDAFGRIQRRILPTKSIYTIDTSTLPKGMYFIKISDKNNNLLKVQKIVKQ